jgi:hypothetical protein
MASENAIRLALHAVVSGLHRSGAIHKPQIHAIVDALAKAAETAFDRGKESDGQFIQALAADIAKD